MISGPMSAAQNIYKCVRRCGLEFDDLMPVKLASLHSVGTEVECELGVCLVDIGGGTTDIAVFTDGAIRHTAVIPIAGDQVTNDIAVAGTAVQKHPRHLEMYKKLFAQISKLEPQQGTHPQIGLYKFEKLVLSYTTYDKMSIMFINRINS